jgi:hypothetical protein
MVGFYWLGACPAEQEQLPFWRLFEQIDFQKVFPRLLSENNKIVELLVIRTTNFFLLMP